jgi:hypothetical protein
MRLVVAMTGATGSALGIRLLEVLAELGGRDASDSQRLVVEEDIDIHDPEALDWAMAYRVNAGLGDMTLFGPSLSSPLDPSTPPEKANMAKYGSGEWTRVLIDATQSWEFEPRPEWGGRHYPAINKIAPELEPESPPAGRSTGSASRTSTTSGGSC